MRWLVILVAGCGRLDFAPHEHGDAPAADAGCGHTFCDDFDRATPPDTGWDAVETGGGTLALEGGALRVDVAFPLAGRVFLTKTLPAPATSIHVGFRLALDVTDTSAEVDLVQLLFLPPPPPCTDFGFFFVRDSTGPVEMQETYTGCGGNTNDTFAFSAGTHQVDLDATATHLVVHVDGASVVDKTVPAWGAPASAELHVGAPGTRTTSVAWVLHYDDVVVDVQ